MNLIKIVMLSFLISSVVFSQVETRENPFWLNWSIGGSTEFINGSVSFNKSLEHFSYQISTNVSQRDIFSRYGIVTFNVGYGYSNEKAWMISSVFLGPSVSHGEGKYNTNLSGFFWGFGASLNAQAYFMPLYKIFPDLGMGIELYYNYNITQTKDVNFRNVYSIRLGFCITNIHL